MRNWRSKSQLKTAVNKTTAAWIDNPYATLQERDYTLPMKTKSPSLHREENVSTAPTAQSSHVGKQLQKNTEIQQAH